MIETNGGINLFPGRLVFSFFTFLFLHKIRTQVSKLMKQGFSYI